MTEPERIRLLNERPIRTGEYVLYWMQSSQRILYNHALAYAIERANHLKQPLVVYFGLTGRYPEANERHLCFMLQGLTDVAGELEGWGVPFIIRDGFPVDGALDLSRDASLMVVDRGYLKTERQWYEAAAIGSRCQIVQVESNAIVPVEIASQKEEYAAATFRPKMHRILDHFMEPCRIPEPVTRLRRAHVESLDPAHPDEIIKRLNPDRSVGPVRQHGGEQEARKQLELFIDHRLDRYDEDRNDPGRDATSHLSAYLHFGHLSPLEIALRVRDAGGAGSASFLEELIVRRELAINFVFYNTLYDQYECLPGWAQNTLQKHRSDPRNYSYTLPELEQALTHDPYWNAAQDQMRISGHMHSYMRMYWGKKILEWSETPEKAFYAALRLNNRYELDGRDPNGYTGVAWCFGKHDRPWGERPVFGNVRYMNAAGLKRKFNPDVYRERVQHEKDAADMWVP
ncbi:MAG: deoxyribodipyrimidine photo-lyase [Methanoregulaceae archaeon]|nr:deoxyribodipyrimidine photo-lyase [Methanoregulaceae archaeon]